VETIFNLGYELEKLMKAVIKRGGKVIASFEGEGAIEKALTTIMAISENPLEIAAALLVAAALAKENVKGSFCIGSIPITIEEVETAG